MFGRGKVFYDCPHCLAELESPLTDAGRQDECPFCKQMILVPGSARLDRLKTKESQRASKAAANAEKARAKEAELSRKVALERDRKAKSKADRQRWISSLGPPLFIAEGVAVYATVIVGSSGALPLSEVYAVEPRNGFLSGVVIDVIDFSQRRAAYQFADAGNANRFVAAIRDAKGSVIVKTTEVTWFIWW